MERGLAGKLFSRGLCLYVGSGLFLAAMGRESCAFSIQNWGQCVAGVAGPWLGCEWHGGLAPPPPPRGGGGLEVQVYVSLILTTRPPQKKKRERNMDVMVSFPCSF